jgi:PAS domain S-box-containing protein
MRKPLKETAKSSIRRDETFTRFWLNRNPLINLRLKFRNSYAEPIDTWFDFYVFKPEGATDDRTIGLIFHDITDRKRREANQAFLAEIGDEMSRLSTADEIMETVGAKIGAYLKVKSCMLVDVDDARGEVTVFEAWDAADMPSLRYQTLPLANYLTEEFSRANRAGETVVMRDMNTDARAGKDYAATRIEAFVTVPFHRNGVWTNYLAVTDSAPRDWRDDEIELFREISNRIFPRRARARAEEALRESETHYRAIVNQNLAGIIEIDLSGQVVFVNRQFCEMVDYTCDELLKMQISDFVHEEDLPESVAKLTSMQVTGQAFEVEKRFVRKDGSFRWVHNSVSPIKERDGVTQFATVVSIDITARKLLEERVRTQFDELENIYRTAPIGLALINGEFRFARINQRLAEINGVPAQAHIGRGIREIVPDIADQAEAAFRQVFETGLPILNVEFTGETEAAPGIVRVWNESWYPLKDGRGETVAVNVVVEEITERRRAEEKLRESEANLAAELADTRQLQKISSQLIREDNAGALYEQILDAAMVLMRSEMGSLQMFFPERNELYLLAWRSFDPESARFWEWVRVDLASTCGAALQKGERVVVEDVETCAFMTGTEDLEFYRLSGIRAVQTTPLISRAGRIVGMISNHWREPHQPSVRALRLLDVLARQTADLIERRQAEEALRESEERLGLIIKSVEDYAIITTDTMGIVNGWNPGAEKIFGFTPDEIIGQDAEILFTPEDRAKGIPAKEMQTAMEKGSADDERFHLQKDGSRFYASGVMHPLKDGKIEGFVKIARDMTERLKAEKAHRDKGILQRLVGAQEDERRRIARDLHDELGQQMTALRLKLDEVRKLSEDDKELCARIDDVQAAASRIDDGVDFLTWELRPSVLDDLGLRAALEKYVQEWSQQAGVSAEFIDSGEKGIRFAPEIEINLYRIVQEALNNVHKHAKANRAGVILDKRGDSIVLIVEDDGVGFNPENKKTHSKGLGLLGMKERAALIGGTIEIESKSKMGTTIYVRVPLGDMKEISHEE